MGPFRLVFQHKFIVLLLFFLYILLWLAIQSFNQPIHLPQAQKSSRSRHSSNSSFYSVIEQLYQSNIKLLLIDPSVLRYLFIDHLSFDNLDTPLITFAIIDQAVQPLLQILARIPFAFNTSTTILTNHKSSVDHIFIEHEHKTLHVAVLHHHYSFYLVCRNRLRLSNADNVHLSYGDKLRAVERVENELHEYLFYYPRNVSHFLWLYQTSEYLYCNRALTNRMENEFDLHQNASQLNTSVKPMRNIAVALDNMEKRYWLAGGTLLGWYRHCGMIPFTLDADFGLFAEEYDESIRRYFLGNPITYLWGALGLVNDSLEFRLFTGKFTLDLFWAYRDGNHRWCGYQINRAKFRRTLPLLPKLCSGALFGYRFSVPCSPVEYLDSEYGKDKWQTPLEKNYTWTNMKYHSVWDDVSWMYAVRLYTKQGQLRTDKFALEWISKHFNYTFTSIPSFLNVLPSDPVKLPPLKEKLVYGPPLKRKGPSMKLGKSNKKHH